MGDTPEEAEAAANLSVADRVLAQFVSAVAEEEDLGEVAARLKSALLGGKSLNDAALRQALFDEPTE